MWVFWYAGPVSARMVSGNVFALLVWFGGVGVMMVIAIVFDFVAQVKPLIWIESVIERHSHSRVEYMVKVNMPVLWLIVTEFWLSSCLFLSLLSSLSLSLSSLPLSLS